MRGGGISRTGLPFSRVRMACCARNSRRCRSGWSGGWGGRKGRGKQNSRTPMRAVCETQKRAGQAPPLQGAEEFVEFVGGVEVGFEVAGGEAFAKVVEAASEEI